MKCLAGLLIVAGCTVEGPGGPDVAEGSDTFLPTSAGESEATGTGGSASVGSVSTGSETEGGDETTGDTDDSDGTDTGPTPGEPGEPVLFFTDIASGPNAGWQGSNERGAAVTVFGRNFGEARGESVVSVDGIPLETEDDYTSWGAAGLRPGVEAITFLVPAGAGPGPVDIDVTVVGVTSGVLQFNVVDGRLLHVEVDGSGAGDGSWMSPWSDIQQAVDAMGPGDIAYVGDGVSAEVEGPFTAAVNLSRHGEPGRPMALVAAPGATVRVGAANLARGFHNWVSDDGTYADHWTIAGFEIACSGTCVNMGFGSRTVNNRITAPNGDGQSGSVYAGEGDAAILGNEFYEVGAADCSKLFHTLYISGPRTNTPPRLPAVGPYEVGWNYFHDNRSNRAVNLYSEQNFSAFVENASIHDNLIVDQRGDGILVGWYVTGENRVYNNVIVRAGLGPQWWDGGSSHAGIRVDGGHEEAAASVEVVHNTVVDCGFAGAEFELSGGLYLGSDLAEVSVRSNIFAGAAEPTVAGESLALQASDWTNLWFPNAPAWDTAAMTEDPAFADPDSDDFRLSAASPVDSSDGVTATDFPGDHNGVARPQGRAPDVGAFEYVEPR